MQSLTVSALLLALLVLCCSLSPVTMIGIGVMKVGGLVPTPTQRGVPRTEPPENGLKKVEVSKPLYKDFYSKTSVIVTHPVSTVLYYEQDFHTLTSEDWITSTAEFNTVHIKNTTVLVPILQSSVTTVLKYDDFEWQTETQLYTTAPNMTTTTVVENTIPFL